MGFPQLPQKRPSMGSGPPQWGQAVEAEPDEKLMQTPMLPHETRRTLRLLRVRSVHSPGTLRCQRCEEA